MSQRTLFDKGPRSQKPRLKRMHVIDAGPGESIEDNMWCNVRMACSRCGLETSWFQVPNISAGRLGIPCPRCNGIPFHYDKEGDYSPS